MHYANGREANVGDPVVGRVYNTPGIIAGTLVSLTPGYDACSAQVEFVGLVPTGSPAPRMAGPKVHATRGDEAHGTRGAIVDLYVCRDYTHASNLLHADDAHRIAEDVYRSAGSLFPQRAPPAADHPAAGDQA